MTYVGEEEADFSEAVSRSYLSRLAWLEGRRWEWGVSSEAAAVMFETLCMMDCADGNHI